MGERAGGSSAGPRNDDPPSVALIGPALHAVSGVSTHLNQLLNSRLAGPFRFHYFQVGREGRATASLALQAWRFLVDPIRFGVFVIRNKARIVHINTSMEQRGYWRDVLFLAVSRILRRKVVYQNHGGALPEEFFTSRAMQALFRFVLRSADVVVLLSKLEFRAYRAFVPDLHIEVIANGIDPKGLTRDPVIAKPGGPLRLVYLGRLVVEKGLVEALDAMALLKKEGRAASLTIAGAGRDEARLKVHSDRLGLADSVHFVGAVHGEAKDDLWRSSHAFIFPTYFKEGLPYALLEAMSAGAVPITTSVGAIPDVMTDGVHGLVVSPRDVEALAAAIRRLDDDRELLAAMAERARQRVLEGYSVARLAGDFHRIYNELAVKR